jgi:hypothetical protein
MLLFTNFGACFGRESEISKSRTEEKLDAFRETSKLWGRNLGSETKFGDLFANRSDYSKGLFYGVHSKVLWDDDRNHSHNEMEPPIELKTRAQSRRNRSRGIPSGNNLQQEVIVKPTPVEVVKPNSKKPQHMNLKKVAALVKDTIVLEHFSTLEEIHWTEDIIAGVRVWINHESGEVSTVCPWHYAPTRHSSKLSLDVQHGVNSSVEPPIEGTGSLVYDPSEFANLENMFGRK